MANKREFKKYVRSTCGALALDIIMAREAFPQVDRRLVQEIITDIAALQATALSRASVDFDRTARDFENRGAYLAARNAYYKNSFAHLIANFDESVIDLVKKMNSALPAEVRSSIKKIISE